MPEGPPAPGAPSQVSLKTAFTICFAVAVTVGTVAFLLETQLALILTLGAVLMAIALDHLAELLVEKLGWRRGWAIAVVVVGLLTALAGFLWIVVPPTVEQARDLLEQIPDLMRQFRRTAPFSVLEQRFGVSQQLQEAVQGTGRPSPGGLASALAAVGSILGAAAGLVTLLFLAVFMLIFGRERMWTFVAHMHPGYRPHVERVVRKTYSAVGGYIGGLLLICVINASLTTTFLALVPRLPYFLPLGILAGSSSLIPYAGPILAGALVTALALASGGLWVALATAAYFVLYGQLEGNILAPFIFRRTVHLNPLVTLLSILFLAELMGLVGAIVAVPIVAAAQIIVGELLTIRRERWIRIESPQPPPGPPPPQASPIIQE